MTPEETKAMDAAFHALAPFAFKANETRSAEHREAAHAYALLAELRAKPPGEQPIKVPRTMTPKLAEILGMPNFECAPLADAFRDIDGIAIARRSEAEQAFVLHWLLGVHEQHGDGWRMAAGEQLQEMLKRARQRPPPDEPRPHTEDSER